MKNTSPITSGETASALPPPIPIKRRATSRLLYDVAKPAHMELRHSNSELTSITGRRPKVLASGTHQRLDTPSINTLTYYCQLSVHIGDVLMGITAMSFVRSENDFGGYPNAAGVA
jgi:hypothetical protein